MHELSITQSLLDKTLAYAKENALKSVDSIYIRLGFLTSFVDESIDIYWKEISKGTLAENAKMLIKRMPSRIKCLDCLKQFEVSISTKNCPDCGGSKLLVINGDELMLEKIEGKHE